MQNYTLDSREVAEMIGKEHKDLLRDIRRYCEQLAESKIALGDFFAESTYLDSNNQSRPCFSVTKKGCEFISHKLTGRKGAEFTAQYINRFHKMEEAIKQNTIDRSQLSPQMQMFYAIADSQAKMELEQKRLAQEVEEVKQNQAAIANTFQKISNDEDFKLWANKCIARIAESHKFDKGVGTNSNYAFARNESYERLKSKWKCNLDDRVSRAKGRALQRNPGISKTELDSINKLTVISADKSLRPVYETVIKEMMIAYCVESNAKINQGGTQITMEYPGRERG